MNDGFCASTSAAAPATCGVAIDVPEIVLVAVSLVNQDEVMFTPGAKMSRQVPMLENEARVSLLPEVPPVAPTVIAAGVLAGVNEQALAPLFKDILSVKKRIGEIDQETGRLSERHRASTTDQDRVRQNLELLRKTAGNQSLQRDLLEKLTALETELGRYSAQLVRLSEDKAEAQRKLSELIGKVTLDATKK